MLTLSQALLLGVLQGVTELFPISSLGHTVIIPSLLGWHIDQHDPFFLGFIVATHFATAVVLALYFRRDWVNIIRGVVRSLVARRVESFDTYARLGWLLVVGTIPAGLLGLLFEEKFKLLFAIPRYAGAFLLLNGLLLLGVDALWRRQPHSEGHDDARVAGLSWLQALKIGVLQCLALLPGFSLTGATLSGGLVEGLSHQDAARFSFLLATPIIFAAAVLKLPKLVALESGSALSVILLGSLAAALAAYLSVRFLSRYFVHRKLTPFGIYCVIAGLLTVVVLG